MKIDLSLTIVSIIALCAIISPVLVSIINNRHDLKIKKIEITNNRKIKAFEQYLTNIECLIFNKGYDLDKIGIYKNSLGCALLHSSNTTRAVMLKIDNELDNKNFDKAEMLLDDLCLNLQNDLQV